MTPRVAIFVDYQNVHFSALNTFQPPATPRQRGHVVLTVTLEVESSPEAPAQRAPAWAKPTRLR